MQATITGAAAVEKVLKAKKGDASTVVGLQGSKCIYAPLVESVIEVRVGFLSAMGCRRHGLVWEGGS